MSFFSRLPADAGVRHAMVLNKPSGRALVQLHTEIMRQPSQLSVGERELIAAYVSALNACQYCLGVHSVTAENFGSGSHLSSRPERSRSSIMRVSRAGSMDGFCSQVDVVAQPPGHC